MKHDVFVSYSSRDSEAAQIICSALEQNDVKCWIAPRDVPAGTEYGDLIDDAIRAATIAIVIFSETAATSMWVKAEMNIAFEEQKVIIPFRLDQTPLKGQSRLILNHKHWIDAYPNYKMKIDDLVAAVLQALGRAVAEDTASTNELSEPANDIVVKKIVLSTEEEPKRVVKAQPTATKPSRRRNGLVIALSIISALMLAAAGALLYFSIDKPSPDTSQGLYPFTSERMLTDKDLKGMSTDELKMMRNEIFARHGYIFNDPKLNAYFKAQSWYKPTNDINSVQLNAVESYNANFIKEYEQKR